MMPARTPKRPLAYCTNVASAPSPAALEASLDGLWREVRERAGLDRLALGLWFPREVAAALATDEGAVRRLGDALERNGLAAVTCVEEPHGLNARRACPAS